MTAEARVDETPALPDWCLGAVSPRKVIHRARCRHAERPYLWAREYPTAPDLAFQLVYQGAADWHHACKLCAADLAADIERYASSIGARS